MGFRLDTPPSATNEVTQITQFIIKNSILDIGTERRQGNNELECGEIQAQLRHFRL
jgi:hypothetical protein